MDILKRITNLRFTAFLVVVIGAHVLTALRVVSAEVWGWVCVACVGAFIGGQSAETILGKAPGKGE